MAGATMNIGEVTHTLTLRVTGIQSLRIRTWLSGQIMKLAAWVLGTKLSLEFVDSEDFDDKDLPPAFDGEPYRNFVKVGEYAVPTACSINAKSPLHHPSVSQWGAHVAVLLDGVVQNKVISFDSESGWVRRYLTRGGDLYIAGDDVANEVVRGKVELVAK